MDKDKDEKRVERALDAQFPTLQNAPSVHSWLQEMGRGLFDGEESSEDEDDSASDDDDEDSDVSEEKDDDRLSVNPPVRREDKKTLQQKRKDKERKLKVRRLEH